MSQADKSDRERSIAVLPFANDFEVHAEGIDQGAIIAAVHSRVEARRADGERNLRLPTFVLSGDLSDGSQPSPLMLHLVRLRNPTLTLASQVVPSRLPIIGRIVDRFRAELHRLVLFYLNQVAAKQSAYNVELVRAVQALQADLDDLRLQLDQEREAARQR